MEKSVKRVANNILDFLIDPTKIPVKERLYFRPEEILKNESYEKAKADAFIAYKDQKHNSDFYPQKNRSLNKEARMDRRSLIASLDVLSKNFSDKDPISTDLRAMAHAVSQMSDEELGGRLAEGAPDLEGTLVEAKAETFPCPKCGTKVLKQTGYCVKCKAKVKPKTAEEEVPEEKKEEKPKEKAEAPVEEEVPAEKPTDEKDAFVTTPSREQKMPGQPHLGPEVGGPAIRTMDQFARLYDKKDPKLLTWLKQTLGIKEASEVTDLWSKEASDLVAEALVADIIGVAADEEPEPEEKPKEEAKPEEKKEPKDSAKACPIEEKKEEKKEEPKNAAKACPVEKEEKKDEKDAAKVAPVKEEEEKPKDVIPPPDKESKVVDTGVLSSVYYEGIEIPTGLMTAEDVGELTAKEKEELSKLF